MKIKSLKSVVLMLSLLAIMGLAGCTKKEEVNNQNKGENIVQEDEYEEPQDNQEEAADVESIEDYSSYEGKWTLDGAPVIDSGALLTITIKNGNELEGDLFTCQNISDREAEIENISGTIVDGECSYYFTDDGWEGSGTLLIHLDNDKISVEVKDYVMADINLTGYGISGTYNFVRLDEANNNPYNLKKYNNDWSYEQIQVEIDKRQQFRDGCFFYKEFTDYMETKRNCVDYEVACSYLYDTDKQYYTADDFSGDSWLIINLAKNEIYARHGYIFTDPDVYDFFMSQLWYIPEVKPEDFDDSVFNEYEKANLQILSRLDNI